MCFEAARERAANGRHSKRILGNTVACLRERSNTLQPSAGARTPCGSTPKLHGQRIVHLAEALGAANEAAFILIVGSAQSHDKHWRHWPAR